MSKLAQLCIAAALIYIAWYAWDFKHNHETQYKILKRITELRTEERDAAINVSKMLDEHIREIGAAKEHGIEDVQPVQDASSQPIADPTTRDNMASEISYLNWSQARLSAISTGRPSWIRFTRGRSCLPCENFRSNVATDPNVIDASEQFVCVKFNLADDPKQESKENLAALKAFGIDLSKGVPQDLFLPPKWGGKIYKVYGNNQPQKATEFVAYLNDWAAFFRSK